jgi:hypothetical protein
MDPSFVEAVAASHYFTETVWHAPDLAEPEVGDVRNVEDFERLLESTINHHLAVAAVPHRITRAGAKRLAYDALKEMVKMPASTPADVLIEALKKNPQVASTILEALEPSSRLNESSGAVGFVSVLESIEKQTPSAKELREMSESQLWDDYVNTSLAAGRAASAIRR